MRSPQRGADWQETPFADFWQAGGNGCSARQSDDRPALMDEGAIAYPTAKFFKMLIGEVLT
jgi:hypothetical protein